MFNPIFNPMFNPMFNLNVQSNVECITVVVAFREDQDNCRRFCPPGRPQPPNDPPEDSWGHHLSLLFAIRSDRKTFDAEP